MEDSLFQGFGQFSRPDIGLASDNFANLSEIFESDRRDALRNIGVSPETLDSLYGLSDEISREDLRSASGLEKLLLPTLHQLDEVFKDEILRQLFVNKKFYSPDYPIGGSIGSSQVKNTEIILFNGSIQSDSVLYRENTLGESIFGDAIDQNVEMSTSRASLFNVEIDENNPGYYATAKYSGNLRVRRRSHVNRIFLPKSGFLAKPDEPETPTHTLTLIVDNGNTGTSEAVKVKLLATKNTPLKLYCRIKKGSIKFTFTEPTTNSDPYFYGIQIQPAQQKPNSPVVDFLPVTVEKPESGLTEFIANIDITSTGYQNLYDLYLYVYVNPAKIKGMEFSNIQLKEFPDQKDIGLVGFDNLEILSLASDRLTILPLWLKTLRTKLKILDLSSSEDTWRNGPMGWFDIRNSSATASNITGVNSVGNKVPLYTAVSYLTIPKEGGFLTESSSGSDWSDEKFEKYLKGNSLLSADYREFSALETLNLGDRFYGKGARFDDVFPELTNLSWSRPRNDTVYDDRNYQYIFDGLPKLNNNEKIIGYNIALSRANGDITEIGTSTNTADDGYVSKYKMRVFDIGGKEGYSHEINGFINDPNEDWSAWKNTATSINIEFTNVEIDLQTGTWEKLNSLDARSSGGVKFDTSSHQTLNTPKLQSLNLVNSGTNGLMPKLGNATNTNSLKSIDIGRCNYISASVDSGIDYLLPPNFAPARTPNTKHKLESFYADYLKLEHRFRRDDFENLDNLTNIFFRDSWLTGRFPKVPVDPSSPKGINVSIGESRFYDLSSLSITQGNSDFASNIRRINADESNRINGGAILPSLEGSSNSGIEYINLNNCLPSQYPPNWSVAELREACVKDGDAYTTVSGLSLTTLDPTSSDHPNDIVYKLTGGSDMKTKVMVNDEIRNTEDEFLAKVLSVSNSEVIISDEINFSGDLRFYRKTVDISNSFQKGYSELSRLRLKNCRLSGKFNIRNGFSKTKNTTYPGIIISNNILTGYEEGCLNKIFRGSSRNIDIDLSNNNFPPSEIIKIIKDVSSADSANKFRNCKVYLTGNKLTSSNKYSNYDQQDIFPVSTSKGSDRVTDLYRNERFTVHEKTTVTLENETGVDVWKKVSTVNRSVPAQEISGSYYKFKVESTQFTVEHPLATAFKNLKGIKVELGFIYKQPNTTPVVTSTKYGGSTTEDDSITDSGLEPLGACPTGVGDSGSKCWKNSSNLVFKLITT